MSNRVKVHMIGNAHLDPVWLWSWQAGVDEALATAYTAVKLLKEYPEFIFTRSDSWFHQIIEKLNPELFSQVKKYIQQGRWQLVGGWHIQPDCNLPTEYGFRKHIEIGQGYFEEKFGKRAKIGYNVDSFGHVGTLPRMLKEAGYHSYIFMRPGAHEKQYPTKSQVFWWEAADSNHRVLTYRIPVAYCCPTLNFDKFIRQVIDESDTSLGHIMCFYGVGDHGGGPTRKQLDFILNNRETFDGYELVMSHPQAYFDAVKNKTQKLPIVKGELQYHAIGCYSVLHRIKQEVRQAEHKLVQAERVAKRFSKFAEAGTTQRLQKSWEDVLFNQFHDTYGGTCLKSAYPALYDQLGRARANADDEMVDILRRYSLKLPRLELGEKNYLGYFAVTNPHDEEHTGWVEHEFFRHANTESDRIWGKENKLVAIDLKTKKEREVICQGLKCEAILDPGFLRVLLPVKLAGGETQIFGIRKKPAKAIKTDVKATASQIKNCDWQIRAKADGLAMVGEKVSLGLSFEVHKELSDTWTHDQSRLGDGLLGTFAQKRSFIEESGPLRACLTWEGSFRNSKIQMLTRVYHNEKLVELIVRLLWNEPKTMVKMTLTPKGKMTSRVDGIAGGSQVRTLDGREYPFADWTLLGSENGSIAVISPDIFGWDAQAKNARFTLVRSPGYAHHIPAKMDAKDRSYQFIDMGEHEYRVLIATGKRFGVEELKKIAEQIQQPAIHWDPPYRENYPLG
jgi:alpha-mannosidase